MNALIDDFLPRFQLRELDHVAVVAHPDRAWQAVRNVDLYRLPVARALFALRELPARLLRRAPPLARTARLDDFTGPAKGFHILAQAGHEIVVGSVGRFWQPRIAFAPIEPATFGRFSAPGWGKLAYELSVVPRVGGGSWITFELRVGATDERSWTQFMRYWRLIGKFSRLIRRQLMALLVRDLGAPGERTLPGDELVPDAGFTSTMATIIDAPPAKVWPWLVQMGCRRAGWYSWDRLDNGGVPSADRIVAELQHLDVGDLVPATPKDDGGFEVLAIDAERRLTLGSRDMTWTFALEPIGSSATNLVVRVRARLAPTVRSALTRPFLAGAHLIMEHRQLQNLKRRAEG